MRKVPFVKGEYYHIYNRGVDKRNIFGDQNDLNRFFQSILEFNTIDPIGSIYENSFVKDELGNETSKSDDKLVNFIAYCINPNHFHFILEPRTDGGLSEFMKRVSGGYTKYFNNKYERTGSLFQGVFKSVHVSSNEQLLHLSAYVNLNNEVHQLGNETSKLMKSSMGEYLNETRTNGMCEKDIVLDQFRNSREYEKSARETVKEIVNRRKEDKELINMIME